MNAIAKTLFNVTKISQAFRKNLTITFHKEIYEYKTFNSPGMVVIS